MYYQVDQLSLLGMSRPQLLVPEKNSKMIQIEYILRPTLVFPKELEKDHKGADMEHSEAKSTSPIPLAPSSSSSSPDQQLGIEEDIEIKREEAKEATNDDDDDDGYHTPTSPSHRIPMILKCPPAPRKKKVYFRRKPRGRRVCLQIFEVVEVGEIGLALDCPEADDGLGRRTKKARGEVSAIAES